MKRLSQLLDKKSYQKLVNEFGGQRIWVPKSGNLGHRDTSLLNERNDRIISLANDGKSVKEIAEKFQLYEKRIYHILSGQKKTKLKKEVAFRIY